MTERTVRMMAKDLAGKFYDDNRSSAFRKTFPTLKSYMRGQWHKDGDIVINKPGWMYHIDLARKVLGMMLSQPDSRVNPAMKNRIYEALLEENARGTSLQGRRVVQRKDNEPLH